MDSARPLTVDQFLAASAPDAREELIAGTVVPMPPPHYLHALVKANALEILLDYLRPHPLGRAFTELGFRLDDYHDLAPDIGFVLRHRLLPGLEGPFPGAPDLAVEIVVTQSAADLNRKVTAYLRSGTRAVWTLYPRTRSVTVYHPGTWTTIDADGVLEEPELLPGFSIPVASFFRGM